MKKLLFLENEFVKFWIEDNILHSEYKIKTDITKEVAIETIRIRHEISNGKFQYYCMDLGNVKNYNKQARDYVEKYGQDYIHACAMLVNSHITKFIFNTFVATKKVIVPFRAFKTKESAIEWLEEMKHLHKTEQKIEQLV